MMSSRTKKNKQKQIKIIIKCFIINTKRKLKLHIKQLSE